MRGLGVQEDIVRRLRQNMTEAEAKLWAALRNKQVHGYKFRRQHRVAPYVVDFVCPEASLAIELDGGQHATADETERTAALEAKGLRVLRFWNNEVLGNIDGVLAVIAGALEKSPSPNPLPRVAGERTSTGVLGKVRRVVVKIGSALLVEPDSGRLREPWFSAMCEDIAAMRARGQEVIVVSSGAIALGRRALGLKPGELRLEESQAAAACGQIRLAHAWQEGLAKHELTVAQILLTLGDTEARRHYLNARSTLNTLLKLGSVPVINENDTVATNEIRFGDNDRLAARVAEMVSADCLVLLSDIDGLYTADPGKDPTATFLPEVRDVTAAIERMAGGSTSGFGRGGMITKIAAARVALNAGCRMVIAQGKVMHPLRAVEQGGRCTWFVPKDTPLSARKQWIGGTLKPSGTLVVDSGAVQALRSGKSLLPAGVVKVEGRFDRGDAVLVRDQEGQELGRGLVAYSAEDAGRIKGHKSGEIEAILGYRGRDEVIHRDDLVLR